MITKTLLAVLGSVMLTSCIFEFPFETEAKIPVDATLLGRWELIPDNTAESRERMLVLQHSDNEYVVEYPVGEKALYFRAFAVELAGEKYFQIQLIGNADGPVAKADRKYHLLKLAVKDGAMEMRTLNTDVFGKHHGDSTRMIAAFIEHKSDPKLFGEAEQFRRIR